MDENEQREKTEPRRLSKKRLTQIINRTLESPVADGYHAKCYCRRCGASWDMRATGIRILKNEDPSLNSVIPGDVRSQKDKEEVGKYYFILEPCFVCRTKDEKIKTEAKLRPNLKKSDNYNFATNSSSQNGSKN